MRKTVLGSDSNPISPTPNTILAALPSDLRAVMKTVTKYSDNVGGGSDTANNVTATTDYLWLLAEYEVQGTRFFANSAEQNSQTQYDYYKAGNSMVKYMHSDTTRAVLWWLRSVGTTQAGVFCRTNAAENLSGIIGASASCGVAPAFAA